MDDSLNPHYNLDVVLSVFSLDRANVLCVYLFGSRVYGTCNQKSDYDYVIVVEDGSLGEGQDSQQIPGQGGDGSFDAQIETRTRFLTMLQKHNFVALECLWLENKFRLLETVSFEFFLDLAMLRSYVSENSSYSWVRAKKKLVVEKDFDPYRAKKTLWHAFRVLEYGMQIAKYGKLVNYQACTALYHEIMQNTSENWKDYEILYKKKFNATCSEFRLLAPK